MSRARAAIILAAGQGKRMKSETPKMLHPIGGRALVDWSIALARDLACARTVVVIPPNAPALAERVTSVLGPNSTAIQEIPRGTGDAARSAASVLAEFDGDVVVYFGDTPLIRTETLARMFAARGAGANVVVLAFYADDPTGYGRIILDDAGAFVKNVEHRDANKDELAIHLCNAGALVADAKVLFSLLAQLRNDNAQQEFYLTDIPGMARVAGMNVGVVEAQEAELLGVNSRSQLADAEAAFQKRAREAAMEAGVTLIDPASVFFSYDTVIEPDVVIEPHVFFSTGVKIGRGAVIHAYCHFERTEIGPKAEIGPFARFRPGSKLGAKVKIGNFVEVKNSNLAEGVKANHLAYIGDTDVGARTNIGAGAIVCNYDGFDKHRSTIGEDAFIGSDTALVSPVTIGNRAYTGTGSVITKDVPDGALGVARTRQVNLEGWADKNRDKKLAAKAAKKDPEGVSEDIAKFNAAQAALDYVKDGMIVGLGTGSTSASFVRQLGERVRQGLRVKGVPTSEATRNLAEQVGVPLLEISQITSIDVDVDGADEVDPAFRLIKGGGGALLREKIVAAASKQMVVIADESKWVETLGAFPLPVEVTRFGFALTQERVAEALRETGCAGGEVVLRVSGKANEPVITDGGNYILDAHAKRIPDADALSAALKQIAGVVEHGLFIGLSQVVILGKAKGADVKTL